MESSAPEIWGEDAQAWVDWAVGAETVAAAAEIWGCDEAQAGQWIVGWACDRGWREAGESAAPEHIDLWWQWLRGGVPGSPQAAAAQHDGQLTEPGWTTAEYAEVPADTASGPEQYSPTTWWEFTAAESMELAADNASGLEHGHLAGAGWTIGEAEQVLLGDTSGPEQDLPPENGLNDFETEELKAVSAEDMLAGLASEKSLETLADEWDLTVEELVLWAQRAALTSWSINCSVEYVRDTLRALKSASRPGQADPATPLPRFTHEQLNVLGALRHRKNNSVRNIADYFNMSQHSVTDALEMIGEELRIKGDAAAIRIELLSQIRPPGELSHLHIPWPPPFEEIFTQEHIRMLAGARDLRGLSRSKMSRRLYMTESEIRALLEVIGRKLDIHGTAGVILKQVLPRLEPGGDLAYLLPHFPSNSQAAAQDEGSSQG